MAYPLTTFGSRSPRRFSGYTNASSAPVIPGSEIFPQVPPVPPPQFMGGLPSLSVTPQPAGISTGSTVFDPSAPATEERFAMNPYEGAAATVAPPLTGSAPAQNSIQRWQSAGTDPEQADTTKRYYERKLGRMSSAQQNREAARLGNRIGGAEQVPGYGNPSPRNTPYRSVKFNDSASSWQPYQ